MFQVPTPKMRLGDAFVGIGVVILRALGKKESWVGERFEIYRSWGRRLRKLDILIP